MRSALAILVVGFLSGCTLVYMLPTPSAPVATHVRVVDARPNAEVTPPLREKRPILFLGDGAFAPTRLDYLQSMLDTHLLEENKGDQIVVRRFRTLVYTANAASETSSGAGAGLGILGSLAAGIFDGLIHSGARFPTDFFLSEIELEVHGVTFSEQVFVPFTGLIDLDDARQAAARVHEKAILGVIDKINGKKPNQTPEPTAATGRGSS